MGPQSPTRSRRSVRQTAFVPMGRAYNAAAFFGAIPLGEHSMKFRFTQVALLVGAVTCAPLAVHAQQAPTEAASAASAPGKGMIARTVRAQAVVSAIDATTRTVTLKTHSGKEFEVVCGPEVKNFDQLKVGDKVNVRYAQALTLELKKVGAPTGETGATAAAAAAPVGAKPAAAVGTQVKVVADVTAVNHKTRMVTLKGPQGNTVDLKVDPSQLKLVKVGDKVEATYTEALAVSVEEAKK